MPKVNLPPDFLSSNIYSPYFQKKFLLISKCLLIIAPKIVNQLALKWQNITTCCLEESHYNQIFSKLFDVLALGETKKVGFLTADGSPHCFQLHLMAKYLKRGLNKKVKFYHFVVANNQLFKVSYKTIIQLPKLAPFGKLI